LFCPDERATAAAGVRLITLDRPGFGRSDARPGRSLLSWVDDYVEVARQLELDACPIIGWSGGGPYALACAVRAPEVVSAVGLAASDGPWDEVPGALDALPAEVRAIRRELVADPGSVVDVVRARPAWYADDWERMFASVGTLGDDPDDVLMSQSDVLEPMKVWMGEGARQGAEGYVEDWIAELGPWGFSLADIDLPVFVWWGEADRLVDRAHTEYLAAAIPGASLLTYPGEGHLFPVTHWAETLDAILTSEK
jgi:pimeloyl-ACP methyl ester carboxylesterase